ncbi:unnamed protein product, partial [Scytosiphon promiscuus]
MQVAVSPRSAYTVQISCYEAEIAGFQVLAQTDAGAGVRIDALRAQIKVLEQKIAEIDEDQRRRDAAHIKWLYKMRRLVVFTIVMAG